MSLELSGTTPAIKGVAGSVSAPALTGDDVDTGISFPSANTIKFSTGGVERMSITDSGVTGAGGKFASYAILVDQKTSGTNGGSFTSGDWRTRDLNTEIADPDGIVSISSNQFTLQAGSYLIKAHAPAYKVGRHQIALYDITASSYVETGSSAYVDGGESVSTDSFLTARFTCSGANVYEIRHQCGTGFNTYGFGVSILNSFAAPAENNYLTVLILKES